MDPDALGAGPILVPVDFSDGSAAALRWAAALARTLGRRLVVLHVVHDPGAAPGSYSGRSADGSARPQAEVAGELLADFLERCRREGADLPAAEALETRLAAGLPASRILEVAAQVGASQIVMGSRGRTLLSRLLLGSKAERVLQLAPVPVTIVKAAAATGEVAS